MSAHKIVEELKKNSEDYEFYPTTKEIIEALYWDINGKKRGEEKRSSGSRNISLLDIGAGNCKLFTTFKEIADSQPLLEEYFYEKIENASFYEQCTLKQVMALKGYYTRIQCLYNKENGDEVVEEVSKDQFMIMLENTSVNHIDLSNLDQKDKEYLLKAISSYKKPKYKRNEYERMENRIYFKEYKAIEKSQILIDNMPKDVFVIGTDFHEQTLLDKKADYIFCNPPYSEYSQWSEKIIKEATASTIYLVIPQRWGNQKNILAAIKKRDAKVSVVDKFDFLNSEDRKARAKVVLLKIIINVKESDPFKIWFDETFKIDAPENDSKYRFYGRDWDKKEQQRKETIKNQIVKAGDLVSALVELYNQELDKYMRNYQLIGELDSSVLKELKVNIEELLKNLKDKIQGLKHLYWSEIFENLSEITSRLTKKSRENLLTTLRENSNIDFTTSNIRSVVIWVIKNAPKYYDNQLLEVYDNLSNAENTRAYVSDKRFADDSWRYLKDTQYKLDYRIVVNGYRNGWDNDNRFSTQQLEYVQNLIVIARNLGFNVEKKYETIWLKDKYEIYTEPNHKEHFSVGTKTLFGKIKEIFFHTNIPNENKERVMVKNGVTYVYDEELEECFYQYQINDDLYRNHKYVYLEEDIFTTVVGHKNGNVHFQINQNFMKKFNLEAGRLKGWLKSPQEAAEELDITLEEASSFWESNFTLLPRDLVTMLPHFSKLSEVQELSTIGTIEETIDIEVIEDEKNLEAEMHLKLIKDLLKIYDDGTLYGKRSTTFKKSISYAVANHFTDLTEEYKSGKYEGLSRSVVHTDIDTNRKTIGIEIYRTKYEDRIPYIPIEGSTKFVSIEDFEEFIQTNRDLYSIEELSIMFRELINSQQNNLSDNIVIEAKKSKKSSAVKIKETTIFDFL